MEQTIYYYDVATWLKGDANQPVPPVERWQGRNAGWLHFKAAEIISMPDNGSIHGLLRGIWRFMP
ncbi:MAG: hypothetical protein WDM90_05725 [Ferruginibacter sp.]